MQPKYLVVPQEVAGPLRQILAHLIAAELAWFSLTGPRVLASCNLSWRDAMR